MMNFYMVWVAGRGAPKLMYDSLEAAETAAKWLREESSDREIYVLCPVQCLEGRPLVMIKNGAGPKSSKVQSDGPAERKPIVIVKKRRSIDLVHPKD